MEKSKHDDENIVFLDGGIEDGDGNMVAQAGDVVTCYIIKKLIKLFLTVSEKLIVWKQFNKFLFSC